MLSVQYESFSVKIWRRIYVCFKRQEEHKQIQIILMFIIYKTK